MELVPLLLCQTQGYLVDLPPLDSPTTLASCSTLTLFTLFNLNLPLPPLHPSNHRPLLHSSSLSTSSLIPSFQLIIPPHSLTLHLPSHSTHIQPQWAQPLLSQQVSTLTLTKAIHSLRGCGDWETQEMQ